MRARQVGTELPPAVLGTEGPKTSRPGSRSAVSSLILGPVAALAVVAPDITIM